MGDAADTTGKGKTQTFKWTSGADVSAAPDIMFRALCSTGFGATVMGEATALTRPVVACAAGTTWSTAGTAPCAACAEASTCTTGVKTACIATANTVCNAAAVAPAEAPADLMTTCGGWGAPSLSAAGWYVACGAACAPAAVCQANPALANCKGYGLACAILTTAPTPAPAGLSTVCAAGAAATSPECMGACVFAYRKCPFPIPTTPVAHCSGYASLCAPASIAYNTMAAAAKAAAAAAAAAKAGTKTDAAANVQTTAAAGAVSLVAAVLSFFM